LSSDEKKRDLKLDRVLKSWDSEHPEPASPASEDEVYVISDAERKFIRDEELLRRALNYAVKNLGNKARQKAYAAERAAIEAQFDAVEAELGQARDGRENTATTIPQRSIEPDPKPADNKPPAAVAEIKKPAATPDPAASKIPEPRIPDEKITPEELKRIWSSPAEALHILIEKVLIGNLRTTDSMLTAKAIFEACDAMISNVESEAERNRARVAVNKSVPEGWKDGIQQEPPPRLVTYWDRRVPDSKERRVISTYVSDAKTRLHIDEDNG
jgi:hypothetical protein